MCIIDGHENIAWNALTFGRDYTCSALTIRKSETSKRVLHHNGHASLGLKEWGSGQIGVIFAAILVHPYRRSTDDCYTHCYHNAEDAHQLAQAQLDYYHRLEDENPQLRIIYDTGNLNAVVDTWRNDVEKDRQIGLVLLMEGADPVREPQEVEYWAEQGVRIIGPAWASTRYSGGTGEPGPLTDYGCQLLEVMDGLGIVLDVSHMSEQSYYQAMDQFRGNIIASHSNPRQLAVSEHPERALSDAQIISLAERDGVIGVVPYNRFLKTLWRPIDGKHAVTVKRVAEAVDIICQLTGSSSHAGIGSDFDGGFGAESIPSEMDTVADLRLIGDALADLGYSEEDIERVLRGNWMKILQRGLPI